MAISGSEKLTTFTPSSAHRPNPLEVLPHDPVGPVQLPDRNRLDRAVVDGALQLMPTPPGPYRGLAGRVVVDVLAHEGPTAVGGRPHTVDLWTDVWADTIC